jgi:hypothetical protein
MKSLLFILFAIAAKFGFSQQVTIPTVLSKEEKKSKHTKAAQIDAKRQTPPLTIEHCDYMLKAIDNKWNSVAKDSLQKEKAKNSAWFKQMEERKKFYTAEKLRLQQSTK